MIPAIPRYLLPHSGTLIKKISEDKWGGCETSETPLSFVRVIPCHGEKFSLSGDIPEISAKMFFDMRSSVPVDPPPDFCTGDIIRFNSREYIIVKVNVCYADSSVPHHLEVMLA